MDFILMGALAHYKNVNCLTVIYNIACQYHKKLFACIANLAFEACIKQDLAKKSVRFFIDKFHQEVHGDKC
jgi:hypothetical protein